MRDSKLEPGTLSAKFQVNTERVKLTDRFVELIVLVGTGDSRLMVDAARSRAAVCARESTFAEVDNKITAKRQIQMEIDNRLHIL
jgi:hypothetical protein